MIQKTLSAFRSNGRGLFRFRTDTCCRRARISVWSAARSAKISMILCMPERVSGGDAKFQGFCVRWNKWEGQDARTGLLGGGERNRARVSVLIVLHHERRQIVHFGVTAHPTAGCVAQQITEAFLWDSAPRYVIRNRDSVYGDLVCARIKAMGLEEVVTAPRSPRQNPFVERMIGSIGWECLDHLIVIDERHRRCILASYFNYYHRSRTHLSLGKDSSVPPAGRERESRQDPSPSHRLADSTIVTSDWPPERRPHHCGQQSHRSASGFRPCGWQARRCRIGEGQDPRSFMPRTTPSLSVMR